MLYYIKKILSIEPYSVICRFNTGEVREIDLFDKIRSFTSKSPELFDKLLDKKYFKTVKLDSYGTLCWDNKIDFCPDVLYQISRPCKLKKHVVALQEL